MRSDKKLALGFSSALRFWTTVATVVAFYIPPLLTLCAFVVLTEKLWFSDVRGVLKGMLMGLQVVVWYTFIDVFVPRRELTRKKLGIGITRTDQPDLFQRIADAAHIAGVEMPADVLLSFEDTNFLRLGMFGRRTLLVGFVDLQMMTVSQFQALLIRKLCRRHLRLPIWTSRIGSAHSRCTPPTYFGREGLTQWYTLRFWKLMNWLEEPFEAAEDRFAAQAAGSDVLCEALSQSVRKHAIIDNFVVSGIGNAGQAGFLLPMTAGFQAMLADPKMICLMDEFLRLHGGVQRRIWGLRSIPPAKERNDAPVLSQLRDLPSLERQLTVLYLKQIRAKTDNLKPLQWEERGLTVEIPLRRQFVATHAKHLENLRLQDVFRIAQEPYSFAVLVWGETRNIGAPVLIPLDIGERLAKSLLGSAIMCRLQRSGWNPVWQAGKEVMTRDDRVFDPDEIIDNIHTGQLSQDQWNQQIEELGLFPTMPLAYISGE